MTATRLILLTCIALTLTGCGIRDRLFGRGAGDADRALPYRAQLSKSEDRRDFTVRVRAGGASLNAVRETVRFQATRYCLSTFGGSEALWAIDAATGDWAFTRQGEDMVFTGRCVAR